MSCHLWFEVNLLASRAKVQVTLLAIVSGFSLLASLALDVVGIHGFPLGRSSHRPSSEVVRGEVLNSSPKPGMGTGTLGT